MIQLIMGSRRIVIAAVAAALLGGTALLSVSPAPASAAAHPCGEGEFCLYFNEDANGGYYHSEGSDPNLDNDRYTLPRNWWNNIESYRWVTNRECEAAGPISLG
jgi:hypothetical protein